MCVHIFPPFSSFPCASLKVVCILSSEYCDNKVMNIDRLPVHNNLSEAHSGNPYFPTCGLGVYSLHRLSALCENNFLLSFSGVLISSMQWRIKAPPLSPVRIYAAAPLHMAGSPA